MSGRRDVEQNVEHSRDASLALEVEATLQIGAVDRYASHRLNVIVAVHEPQVGQVHRILGGLLWMAPEPEGLELEGTPIRSG